MYKAIILSSCLFGSFYVFSQSLEFFINKSQSEKKQLPYKLFLLNGFTFILSGSVIIYVFTLLVR